MENNSLGLLVSAFIMIILGTSLIVVVANQERAITTLLDTQGETVDISLAKLDTEVDHMNWDTSLRIALANVYAKDTRDEWKKEYGACAIVVSNFSNLTEVQLASTDFNITADGYLAFLNTSEGWNQTLGSNSTLVSYTHCPDEYVAIAWHRSILFLVPGFFALAILGAGIALFYGVMKKEGIL